MVRRTVLFCPKYIVHTLATSELCCCPILYQLALLHTLILKWAALCSFPLGGLLTSRWRQERQISLVWWSSLKCLDRGRRCSSSLIQRWGLAYPPPSETRCTANGVVLPTSSCFLCRKRRLLRYSLLCLSCARFDGVVRFEDRPARRGALVITQGSPYSAENLATTVRPARVIQCRPWNGTRWLNNTPYSDPRGIKSCELV